METKILNNNSLTEVEIEYICKWISNSGELELISSEVGTVLNSEILKQWLSNSKSFAVAFKNKEIIAFATLSNKEEHIADYQIEICHLIVKPEFRRFYNGSTLVLALSNRAKELGFGQLVGRVVNKNEQGKLLLKSLRWQKLDDNLDFVQTADKNLTWYFKDIK